MKIEVEQYQSFYFDCKIAKIKQKETILHQEIYYHHDKVLLVFFYPDKQQSYRMPKRCTLCFSNEK